MHENGICHRDIKPNNILSDEEGKRVKIADFNVAKFSDDYKKFSPFKKFKMKMWLEIAFILIEFSNLGHIPEHFHFQHQRF